MPSFLLKMRIFLKKQGKIMSKNSTFEKKMIVGTSEVSISDAIQSAINTYSEKTKISWFEVVETRGRVTPEGEIEYQVTINIGYKTN